MATQEEILKLVFDVIGQDGVDKLRASMEAAAKSAEGLTPEMKAAATEIDRLTTNAGKIESFASLKASVTDTGVRLAAAQAGLAGLNAEFDRSDVSSAKVNRSFAIAEKAVADLTLQHNSLSAQLTKSGSDLEKNGISTTNLAAAHADLSLKLGTAAKSFVALSAAGTQTAAGLEKVKGFAVGIGEALKTAGEHALEFGKKLLEITGIASLIASALAAITGERIFGEGLKEADEFEHAITKAGLAVNATGGDLERMAEAAKQAGADTHSSALEAATALAILAKGAGSANAAIAELKPTLLLAKAAQIDTAQAADILGTAIAEFALKASDSAHVVDILAKTAATTKSDLGDLSTAFGRIAPDAKAAGVSIEETAALFGALSDQGIRGKKATRDLTLILQEMANPTSKLREQLLALGLSGDSLSSVLIKLSHNSAETQRIVEALGTKGGSAFRALVGAAPDIQRLNAVLASAGGAAQNAADKFDRELGGAFKNFKNSFIDAAAALAEPLLAPLAAQLTSAANSVRDFVKTADFAKIRDAVLDFTTKAIEGIKEFTKAIDFKKAAESISNFTSSAGDSLGSLKGAMSSVGSVVEGIAGAIGVVFNALKLVIVDVISVVDNSIANVFDATAKLAQITGKSQEQIDKLKKQAEEFRTASVAAYSKGGEAVAGLVSGLGKLDDAITTSSDSVTAAIPKHTAHAAAIDKTSEATKGAAEASGALSATIEPLSAKLIAAANAENKAEQATKDLKTALGTLGVSLQSDLIFKAEAASKAFDVIVEAQRRGQASIEDVRRAYEAYAKAVEASVKDSDKSAQDAALQQVKSKGYAIDLADTLTKLGTTGANAGNQIASGAHQGAAALSEEAKAAKEAAAQTQQFADRGSDSLGQLDQAIGATRDSFLSVSKAAAEAFDTRFLGDFKNAFDATGIGFTKVINGMAQALADTNTQIANERTQLKGITDQVTQFGEAGAKAFDPLSNATQAEVQRMRALSAQIKDGSFQFGILGQQELGPLQAALDAAIQRAQALKAAAEQAGQQIADLNSQLQDQLDQASGDKVAIENRAFEKQKQHILDLEKTADEAGKRQAELALQRLEQLHQANLKAIADAAAAQQKANNPTGSSGSGGSANSGSSAGSSGASPGLGGGSSSGSGAGIPSDQPQINIHVQGSLIGTTPGALGEELMRLVVPEMRKLQARTTGSILG